MNKFWQLVDSPTYWRLFAMAISAYLSIIVLGHTGKWSLSGAVLIGFYFCWGASKRAIEAKLKEKNT